MPLPPNMGAPRFCVFCASPMPNEAYACPRCGRPQPAVTVPLPASASMPMGYAPPMYPAPATYPLPQMAVFVAPVGVPQPAHRVNPTGMIMAALASVLAIFGFFALPFGVATNLAGPPLAAVTSQSASSVCPAASTYPELWQLCTYFTIGAPLMWGLVILAGIALLAAFVGLLNAKDSPKGAATLVILCGVLSLIGFAYVYFGGASALAALQPLESQGTSVVTILGLGSGGWLMVIGAFGVTIGGFVQRGAN